jgi:mono/diheme cytochrome c family protein
MAISTWRWRPAAGAGFVAAAIILASSGAYADDAEPSGKVLFERFCASCHGVSGKGDGPVAASLQPRPSDLTTLAARHGGKFDEAAVMAVVDGRREVAAHGTRVMPVWGLVFEQQLSEQLHSRYTGLLHTRALVDYLRTIQAPAK